MFKDSNNTKGHGSIRKNKVYGAVGVLALGAAAIVGGTSQASADEVTEAPVNSEPVATSQANADSLMSQATAVATSDVSTPTTTATATNTTDSQPTETVAEVATHQFPAARRQCNGALSIRLPAGQRQGYRGPEKDRTGRTDGPILCVEIFCR